MLHVAWDCQTGEYGAKPVWHWVVYHNRDNSKNVRVIILPAEKTGQLRRQAGWWCPYNQFNVKAGWWPVLRRADTPQYGGMNIWVSRVLSSNNWRILLALLTSWHRCSLGHRALICFFSHALQEIKIAWQSHANRHRTRSYATFSNTLDNAPQTGHFSGASPSSIYPHIGQR